MMKSLLSRINIFSVNSIAYVIIEACGDSGELSLEKNCLTNGQIISIIAVR